MIYAPQYPKVLNLGSAFTENALVGHVIIQEKVDGSQFKFGVNENHDIIVGSKNVKIDNPEENKMFKEGVEYILSTIAKTLLKTYPQDTYFYGEYLQKEKHNVIKYDRIPKNHIVLFDVLERGRWHSREDLIKDAELLQVDVIPEIHRGVLDIGRVDKSGMRVTSPAADFIKRLIETTYSFLGGSLVEGIVIKNYSQTVCLGGREYTLFTKYVGEAFKEKHDAEWKVKSPKGSLQEYIKGFRSEARWQKAIIHLKEKGLLENDPRDIGKLILEVQRDIKEEEKESIKKELYNKFIKDILRTSTRGLPEWYKEKLLENLK